MLRRLCAPSVYRNLNLSERKPVRNIFHISSRNSSKKAGRALEELLVTWLDSIGPFSADMDVINPFVMDRLFTSL